jgi:hypothetical protein
MNTWLWRTRSATAVRVSGSAPSRNFIVVSRRQMRDPNLDQLIAAVATKLEAFSGRGRLQKMASAARKCVLTARRCSAHRAYSRFDYCN